MNRQALDFYGVMPPEMRGYLRYNGWHFNKKMNEFAVSLLKKMNPETNRMESIEPMDKDAVDELLKNQGIQLENSVGYDYVYVANMVKADFFMSSIEDERHHALMIKDIIDDADQADGFIMHRWYADTIRKGMPIDWEEML